MPHSSGACAQAQRQGCTSACLCVHLTDLCSPVSSPNCSCPVVVAKSQVTHSIHHLRVHRCAPQDAAEASNVFTLLMGDKVAPRRAFIEQHGRGYSIEALDI